MSKKSTTYTLLGIFILSVAAQVLLTSMPLLGELNSTYVEIAGSGTVGSLLALVLQRLQ